MRSCYTGAEMQMNFCDNGNHIMTRLPPPQWLPDFTTTYRNRDSMERAMKKHCTNTTSTTITILEH